MSSSVPARDTYRISDKDLKILYYNARSILPKLDELIIIISC